MISQEKPKFGDFPWIVPRDKKTTKFPATCLSNFYDRNKIAQYWLFAFAVCFSFHGKVGQQKSVKFKVVKKVVLKSIVIIIDLRPPNWTIRKGKLSN
jgi:hypothetical protein